LQNSSVTGNDQEGVLLFQHLSATLQCFNAILLHHQEWGDGKAEKKVQKCSDMSVH